MNFNNNNKLELNNNEGEIEMNFNNNNKLELNNNEGEIEMNIYIEERNQLIEEKEKLEQELKKLQEQKSQEEIEKLNNKKKEEEKERLQNIHDTDVVYELVGNEFSSRREEFINLLTGKAIEKISNNGLEEIDDARKEFIRDMVEGAIDDIFEY